MLLVKLMLILHSANLARSRLSVSKHSSNVAPPKQISSTNDRRLNTGVNADSSVSPLVNISPSDPLTRSCSGSGSAEAR
ncbi:hypothetical protein PF008_g20972 [Phytophthora fragariae]|uniref:RxLR effector protein n=2 Tax=Phytophthora fragariae TaxID=53985 RepID=A0A6G0QXX6_9STRA|nr:hypothetical protein PF008_g20972 [Phytophthora fragariae]